MLVNPTLHPSRKKNRPCGAEERERRREEEKRRREKRKGEKIKGENSRRPFHVAYPALPPVGDAVATAPPRNAEGEGGRSGEGFLGPDPSPHPTCSLGVPPPAAPVKGIAADGGRQSGDCRSLEKI